MPEMFNCFMLQSQKMKCLVLSRYPYSDPQVILDCTEQKWSNVKLDRAYRFTSWAFVRTPFAGSFLHWNQERGSSFLSCAGFLPAKDDPGMTEMLM